MITTHRDKQPYDETVREIARLLSGEVLAEKPFHSTLIGNLKTGLFAVAQCSSSDDAVEMVWFFGNLRERGDAYFSAHQEEFLNSRRGPTVLESISTLIASKESAGRWWQNCSNHHALMRYKLSDQLPKVAEIMESRLKEGTPSSQFAEANCRSPEGIDIPPPGTMVIQNVEPTLILGQSKSVLYRTHLNDPHFMPVNLFCFSGGRNHIDTKWCFAYPADQYESGPLNPNAYVVRIDPDSGLTSKTGGGTQLGYTSLSEIISSIGKAVGISAIVSELGLVFFQNGEQISHHNAALALSKEYAQKATIEIGDALSPIVERTPKVAVKRGGIIVRSNEDVFRAIAAIAGFNEASERSVPEVAPDVAEAEDAGRIGEAKMLSFAQALYPPATRETIESVVERLSETPGEHVQLLFDCAGHISDGTYARLDRDSVNDGLFPGTLHFGGGGHAEHHQSRASRETGLNRELRAIDFSFAVNRLEGNSDYFVVNFESLLEKGFKKSDFAYVEYDGSIELNDPSVKGEVKITVDGYLCYFGETKSGNSVFYQPAQDHDNLLLNVKLKLDEYPPNSNDEELYEIVSKVQRELLTLLRSERSM